MILSCPACAARYLLEPVTLGPKGRQVRCAKCGHSWLQSPPADMPREVDVTVPPIDLPELPVLERGGGYRRGLGLPLLILVLLGLGVAGGYFFRARIVAEWPKAEGIYEVLGIPTRVLGAGLELVNITYSRNDAADGATIDVTGAVVNRTQRDIALPPLRISLSDDQERPLFGWTFALDRASIRAGETITFRTEGKNPPPEATKLAVTFAGGN